MIHRGILKSMRRILCYCCASVRVMQKLGSHVYFPISLYRNPPAIHVTAIRLGYLGPKDEKMNEGVWLTMKTMESYNTAARLR